jgi:hypothetical protein
MDAVFANSEPVLVWKAILAALTLEAHPLMAHLVGLQ